MKNILKHTRTAVVGMLASALTVALAAGPVQVAQAGFQFCCDDLNKPVIWANSSQTLKLLTNMQGHWSEPIIRQMAANWSGLAGSSFNFTVVNDNDNSITSGGDGNEAGWFNTAPNNVTPAITTTTFELCSTCDDWTCGGTSCSAGNILEADMQFFINQANGVPFVWQGGMAPPPLENQDFPTGNSFAIVASHELGHAAGLTHSDNGMARMESHLPAGGWFHLNTAENLRTMPLAPDRLEMAFLYPAATSGVDIAAVNYQHRWFTIDPSGTVPQSRPLSWNEVGDDLAFWPRNQVSRNGSFKNALPGDAIDLRICASNLDNAAFFNEVPIRVWVSSDAVITTQDTQIGGTLRYLAGTFAAGHVARCDVITVFAPNVTPGDYFIGYTLFTGTGDGNNTTILNRKITIL